MFWLSPSVTLGRTNNWSEFQCIPSGHRLLISNQLKPFTVWDRPMGRRGEGGCRLEIWAIQGDIWGNIYSARDNNSNNPDKFASPAPNTRTFCHALSQGWHHSGPHTLTHSPQSRVKNMFPQPRPSVGLDRWHEMWNPFSFFTYKVSFLFLFSI